MAVHQVCVLELMGTTAAESYKCEYPTEGGQVDVSHGSGLVNNAIQQLK